MVMQHVEYNGIEIRQNTVVVDADHIPPKKE